MTKTSIRPDKGKNLPVHQALAWCLREEERLGNSFVSFRDGDISIFLLERPFHRVELNDFVLANQSEISTWRITDAMTDSEIRRLLKTDTPFPRRTGSWRTDLSQFHLELNGFDVSNKDDTLLASPDGHLIAKFIIVGHVRPLDA